jgi:3-oxoacyl-[acyl-carrier-protein] synthase III
VAAYLPPTERTSAEVEALIRAHSPGFEVPHGIVEATTGVKTRRVAPDGVEASDLAAGAAVRVLRQTGTAPDDVDLVIFASASQDLFEPATANILQEKIGTSCPVFDLKNACNSFLNGLQVAESLIQTGHYGTVLVAAGETPSRCIRWTIRSRQEFRLSFPGYTFGDAGAAALLAPSGDRSGIYYRAFKSVSSLWRVGTVPGGGSMHPRGDEYSYFRGEGDRLRRAFMQVGPGILCDALRATATGFDDYRCILVHQVSMPFLTTFVELTGAPREKIVVTLPALGNMAAASMPVAFAMAQERGDIQPGDRVMWIGLAAGISLGVVLMRC